MDSSTIFYFLLVLGVSSAVKFNWENCGRSTDPLKLYEAEVHSNSSSVLYASGSGLVGMNITSPVEAKLVIKKKLLLGWALIPCIDKIGSCYYKDICEVNPFKSKSCPVDFERNQLPCKCPISEGEYSAKDLIIKLNILPKWVEKGTYSIKLKIFINKVEVFCISAQITL